MSSNIISYNIYPRSQMSRQEFCRVVNDTYLLDNGERKPGKDGQMRTYDRDGFRRRAGCVIFRNAEETEVLLVSSSTHTTLFIVPGGGVDPGESLCESAEREALEEAGIRGELVRFVGVYENVERMHRTAVFAMHLQVEMDMKEWERHCPSLRQRVWFSPAEAFNSLTLHPQQKEFIIDAYRASPSKHILDTGVLPSTVSPSTRLAAFPCEALQ